MSDFAIQAKDLGKKYLISHQAEQLRYTALRDVLSRSARNFARGMRDLAQGRGFGPGSRTEEFWALRDVNFNIAPSEVVGIIGRNGAGKSTLLKVLSRITEPSRGRVTIRGRIASLLEVGTGFHPELTGRENVFLNGAILGMNRDEIRRKFDEIVDFAGVERFLDTPVKRYSSGMYVRLAFAVAAHLEPEILVVDEVLAVGDVEFQQKCLGKMQNVAGHGRTVLFVSHNIAAIEQLCPRAIHLERGQVRMDGPSKAVISDYLSSLENEILECAPQSDPQRAAEITHIALCNAEGARMGHMTSTDAVGLRIKLTLREHRPDLKFAFAMYDSRQNGLFSSAPPDDGIDYPTQPGHYEFQVMLPRELLMAQRYSIAVALYSISSGEVHTCLNALTFDVIPAPSHFYTIEPNRVGVMQILCKWKQLSFLEFGNDIR
jgi:lipopolysaccharide transport system ATP-binding protein